MDKKEKYQKLKDNIDKTTDRLGMPIDEGIKETVVLFSLLGYRTSGSCEGHFKHGLEAPYVAFCCVENKILQTKYREDMIKVIKKEGMTFGDIKTKYKKELADISTKNDKLIKKLTVLLDDFYRERKVNPDVKLYLWWDSFTHLPTMQSTGADIQSKRNLNLRKKKLSDYQAEMAALTERLRNKYWN